VDPARHSAKVYEADVLLKFSMELARLQIEGDRKFAFEHPTFAKSWNEKCVKSVEQMQGFHTFGRAGPKGPKHKSIVIRDDPSMIPILAYSVTAGRAWHLPTALF
jgi:hypothetical protein